MTPYAGCLILPPMATKNDQRGKEYSARMGRIGGRIGGARRALALSPERRFEIAQAAAKVRWANHKKKGII